MRSRARNRCDAIVRARASRRPVNAGDTPVCIRPWRPQAHGSRAAAASSSAVAVGLRAAGATQLDGHASRRCVGAVWPHRPADSNACSTLRRRASRARSMIVGQSRTTCTQRVDERFQSRVARPACRRRSMIVRRRRSARMPSRHTIDRPIALRCTRCWSSPFMTRGATRRSRRRPSVGATTPRVVDATASRAPAHGAAASIADGR